MLSKLTWSWAMLLAAISSQAYAASGPSTIDPKRLSDTVRTLASDEFEGRAPGTPGEAKTVAFLTEAFRSLGLQPGGENGGWTQTVPLVRTQIGKPATLNVTAAGKTRELVLGRDLYLNTVRNVDRISMCKAPLVFVGYGVTAPERQWDDFKAVDL
ncbi:MAG TPA: hypothetical protein VGQ93_02240, partial [Lysobacter sp.]|nr:hypothetical protein [Lysobacter sp.]